MNFLKTPLLHGVLLAAVVAFAAMPAAASTVTFTYSGTGGGGNITDSATGSFTFTDGLSSVSLSDLSQFSISDSVSAFSTTATFVYSLSDLVAFSATIASGAITDLSFQTVLLAPAVSNATFSNELFQAISLSSAGLFDGEVTYTTGTITPSSVTTPTPEPATWTLCAFGAAAYLVRRRKA